MEFVWKDEVEIDYEDVLRRLGFDPDEEVLERMRYCGEGRFQKLIGYIIDAAHAEIDELIVEHYGKIKEEVDEENHESEEEESSESEEEEDD